jgi:ubiquinone/menaquinone biosynthesis C-methylase UbiE
MKIDNSWNRYFGKENDPGYKRYAYSVSQLFGSVLDIGCGDGFGIYLMNKQSVIKKITGIDNQTEAIQKAKINLKGIDAMILKADVENIPFPNNSFDCIHCGQTLEHVEDDKKAIQEIHRVVRKRVVFSIPVNGGRSEQHVREYKSEKDFFDLISGYFKVIKAKTFVDNEKHIRIVLVTEK